MTGDGPGMSFVERLTPLLATGDLLGAHELLSGLDGQDLAQAKKWFASHGRWCRDLHANVEFAGEDHDERFAAHCRASWILAMCAIELCGPRTAAERVPWASCWDYMENDGEAAFVHLLWDKPSTWVADFVDAASGVRLGGQARNVNGNLSRVLRAVVIHHGLPCPTGRTFLLAWWAGTPLRGRFGRTGTRLADWLAVDPLMPDLLLLVLGAGECGQWPDLPDAVAELVDRGMVDRAVVVDTVLEQLTTAQRPRSQRVLAAILAALDMTAAEVPGGLDYLLGVLATGDRGVQPVLLPWALQLAASAEDWTALADLVAGRPDKRAKEMVLAALKAPETSASAGAAAVRAALDVLGAVDDAAFALQVDAAREKLGLAPTKPSPAPDPVGLWELDPQPRGGLREPGYLRYRVSSPSGWHELMSSTFADREVLLPLLVERVLVEMQQGRFDGSAIRSAAVDLLACHRFSCSALVAALEDVFLAGGLRSGWTIGVDVAALAAAAPVQPARLADLVRLLVRYAPEVPRPYVVPAALVTLAADRSGTKAAVEARALLTALGGSQEPALASSAAPLRRGLWADESATSTPLPSTVSLTDDPILARAESLTGLRDLLSENFNGWAQSYQGVCWWPSGYQPSSSLTGLTEPDRVVAAVVRWIHRDGAVTVGRALRGIERQYAPIDVVAAADAWAAGVLDVETFWRLAREPVVSVPDLQSRWREAGRDPGEMRAWQQALPPFAERLRSPVDPAIGALVVPVELHSPLERFAFLRAVEALLRAESEPVVLSLPTWADGTLDADVLLARLEAVARGSGVVGPLDLVQALHRLRPVDVRLVDRVPAGLRTDPRFTDPEGIDSWDATALVRRWFEEGGLPDLEPCAESGQWTGAPVTPVPFASLRAWPAELADDPWCLGPAPASLRLHPRWVDRVFDRCWDEVPLFDPRHLPSLASGPLGVPFHDRLLALLAPAYNRRHFQCLPTLVFLARTSRIDPAAAAAAARGRHEAGTLVPSSLVKVLQRGLAESLPGLWPMSLAIADALCSVGRRPSPLAELLRVLTTYAHEVPAAAAIAPPGLIALAEATGSTKAHAAARELVSALRAVAS